jgi:pheromone shutdown protein TraB
MRTSQGDDTDVDEWRRAWYHEAVTDIRWAKDRAWSVLQGAVILLAALLTASKTISAIPSWLYASFVALLVVVAVFWLSDLNEFAKKARNSVEDLQEPLGRYQPYPRARRVDPHQHMYLAGQIAVVVTAGLVTLVGILR